MLAQTADFMQLGLAPMQVICALQPHLCWLKPSSCHALKALTHGSRMGTGGSSTSFSVNGLMLVQPVTDAGACMCILLT